jgi:hypothetical protein
VHKVGNEGHVIVSRPIERLYLQAEVARRREDELTRLRQQLEESQLRHDSQVTGHIFKKQVTGHQSYRSLQHANIQNNSLTQY